jgi:hypothetical protein
VAIVDVLPLESYRSHPHTPLPDGFNPNDFKHLGGQIVSWGGKPEEKPDENQTDRVNYGCSEA